MAEPDFERRVERLFAEPPAFADADAFAARLENKLSRGWALRRGLIGAAGVVGGVIAVSQLMLGGVLQDLGSAGRSAHAFSAALTESAAGRWSAILPSDGAVVWTALGAAILLTGFVVSRVIEEF